MDSVSNISKHLGGCRSNKGTFVPLVWDKIIEMYNIKSVIDIGCGYAQSLSYFISKGLTGIGVEGWEYAVQHSKVPESIIMHDYTLGKYIPEKEFDLGWSAEFVEHVDKEYIDNFMATFKKCKYVAMTHAFPRQRGFHHVNCQKSIYWIEIFKNNGFIYLENDSLGLRNLLNNSDGTPMEKGGFVRRGLMVFKRN